MIQKPASSADIISILMREYERVCTDIRALEGLNEKLMTLGMATVSAGLGYGLVYDKAAVFFIVPVLFIGILFYASLNYFFIFSFGGYKRFLEQRINALSGETVLIWEKIVSQRPRPTFISGSLACVYIVILLAMILLSIDRILTAYPPQTYLYTPYVFMVVIVLMLLLLLLSVRRMFRAFTESYEMTKTVHANEESLRLKDEESIPATYDHSDQD